MTDPWEPSAQAAAWPGCGGCALLVDDELACPAYPDGIPLIIISGETDHMVERPGQVPGIVFTPEADSAAS